MPACGRFRKFGKPRCRRRFGSGPYRVIGRPSNPALRALTRNPDYWGRDLPVKKPAACGTSTRSGSILSRVQMASLKAFPARPSMRSRRNRTAALAQDGDYFPAPANGEVIRINDQDRDFFRSGLSDSGVSHPAGVPVFSDIRGARP